MTLLEIYNIVASLVYGDIVTAPPPEHEVTMMQTLILGRHNDCQLDNKFWFQKLVTTFPIVAGTVNYEWPADLKELVSFDAEYSETPTGFTLNETPTENRNIPIIYWSVIPSPAWDEIHEDNITIHLAWYIIYRVTGDMFLKRGEKSDVQAYYSLADEALVKAIRVDTRRRVEPGSII